MFYQAAELAFNKGKEATKSAKRWPFAPSPRWRWVVAHSQYRFWCGGVLNCREHDAGRVLSIVVNVWAFLGVSFFVDETKQCEAIHMKNSSLLTAGLLALQIQPLAFAQTDPVQKDLPALIQVATANTLVLETKASGTIEYQCSKEKDPLTTYKWSMVGPKAELTDRSGDKVGDYSGPPARWAHKDGSFVTGSQVAVSPNGSKNIPLQLVKADVSGGLGALTAISYVQRVNTEGGVEPSKKCSADNEGEKAEVSYRAEYRFWKAD